MPRSLDVILRSELVERAKAGDKCVFTGTFIVVPDVSQLGLPGGNKAELQREAARAGANNAASSVGGAGVTGLKSLGVRDLQYKTAFLACMVHDADGRVSTRIVVTLPDVLIAVCVDRDKHPWRGGIGGRRWTGLRQSSH